MANKSKNISQTIKGMIWDFHPMHLTDGMYAFAQNAVVEDIDGNGFPILQNEQSNILCANFPSGSTVVGFGSIIEQERVILMLYNPTTGASEIGEIINPDVCRKYAQNTIGSCDNCSLNLLEPAPLETITQKSCAVYQTIQADDCLNFSQGFPISGFQYRLTNCTLQIFFTDDNNGRRWLEFDYVNGDSSQGLIIRPMFYQIIGFNAPPCDDPIYGPDLNCDALNVQPSFTTPCIDFIEDVPGGSLVAGVYQFFICMSDINSNKLTSFLSGTNPIPVFTKILIQQTAYVTDRAIKLQINNLDPTGAFQYYNLAVAKTIDNVTSFFMVGNFPVTQDTYTYSGNVQGEIPLTADDILTLYPYYNEAATVAQSNGILFWADVTENIKPNLQRVANEIVLNWQTIAIPEYLYNDPVVFQKYRGYMRDEVYPFGVQFIFDNGEESNGYHIPGRVANAGDLVIINNNDTIKENNCVDCTGNTSGATQVIPTPGPASGCTSANPQPVLNPNNATQAANCPLIAYSHAPTATAMGSAPAPIVSAGSSPVSINYVGPVSLSGKVTLTGTSPIVSTIWNQLSGPNQVQILDNTSLTTVFNFGNNGSYVFELVVTDVSGNIVTSQITYNFTLQPDQPPIVDPGPDQLIVLPSTNWFVNGTNSSDPNGGVLTFLWSQVSGPNTAGFVNNTQAFTNLTNLISGVYQFQLIATNQRDCSSTGTTLVYVEQDPCQSIPSCAVLQYPVNGSVTSSFNTVVLQWQDTICATSYDVYVKRDADAIFTLEGNTADPSFILSALDPNTVYDWYVVPKSSAGDATGCSSCFATFATPLPGVSILCNRARWQVYNTATVLGGDLNVYNGCDESCYQYGDFAYWESTETYPVNPLIWGELCGLPIRHHKFPDSFITHIHDRQNGSLDYNQTNTIYVIGVKVDQNSVTAAIANAVTNGLITQADANRIVGYRIIRGNRFGNKSVVAKGLLYDVNQYQRKSDGQYVDDTPVYFSNYPFNDTRANPFITDNFDNYSVHDKPQGPNLPFIESQRYTFHSPDTHFNQGVSGTILKLETIEYGQSQGYYSICKQQAKQRFLSNAAYAIALAAGIAAAVLNWSAPSTKTYIARGSVVSALGLAAGELGPFLPYEAGVGAAGIYENIIDITLNPYGALSATVPTEVQTQTVQGKKSDIFNPLYLALKKPYLLPIYPLLIANFIEGFVNDIMTEAGIVIALIESLTKYRDWSAQYQAVGHYNTYTPVLNDIGNKIRRIDSQSYLTPDNIFINEPLITDPTQTAAIKFNNQDRESSLYLRYSGAILPDAGVASGIEDTSRTTLDSAPFSCNFNNKQFLNISSYYASMKNYVPDQYGTVYNIQYLPTGSCYYDLGEPENECKGVYGGDIFINKFALKIKVPYFLATTLNLPNGSDFAYDQEVNLAVPRNYFDNTLGLSDAFDSIGNLLVAAITLNLTAIATFMGRPKSIRACSTNKLFYQNGYIYLYHYGIPFYYVESDYNVNYRFATNAEEGDFFPNQQDLDFWLQEPNVPIAEDNTYNYNNSYSKQNKETFIGIDPPSFIPGRECDVNHPNRIIYSDGENWLVYKADNFFDFPLSNGAIISVDGIENQTVLVRSENQTSIFKSILRLPVDGQTVQVGNGSVFANPPQDFGTTTLGYIGTQHRAILHTEFGHVWADAKRGQIFNVGAGAAGVEEISKNGMKNWFKENLPFRVLRDFPNMPVEDADNAFIGTGLVMAFDKRFNRFLITKRDYKTIGNIPLLYNPTDKEFYYVTGNTGVTGTTNVVVTLGDPKFFKDCSWTASYNFWTKSWIAFHSYKPNYYIDFIDSFASGYNAFNSALWVHNLYNGSYQVFMGKLCPFVVEPVIKFDEQLKVLNSLEFDTEVKRYSNEFDFTRKRQIPGFNTAIVYNDLYNSGLLNLIKTDKNNFSLAGKYPKQNFNSWDVEVAAADYKWRFNQFCSLNKQNTEIPMWIYAGNNEEKILNPLAFNYIQTDYIIPKLRGQWFKARLINDVLSNYKITFKFDIDDETLQFR
jgi:hypothetical protein